VPPPSMCPTLSAGPSWAGFLSWGYQHAIPPAQPQAERPKSAGLLPAPPGHCGASAKCCSRPSDPNPQASTMSHFFSAEFSLAFVAGAARAQSDASTLGDASALPIASAVTGSVGISSLRSSAGATFVVKGVEASAYATAYILERVSDGAAMKVQIT